MKTYSATMVISFDILCNDNGKLYDIGHLSITAKEYADLIKEDLEKRWIFNISKPIIKEIAED